ncbi:MAG: hypothetical protein ACF8QF_08530 [Phycisphaerales bacterium]
MPPDPDQSALDDALDTLRAHRVGALAFDEHIVPIRFVQMPDDGRIVFPAMTAMLDAPELVLFIPEESDEALQLLLSAEPLDEHAHPGPDRWRIHHGEPQDIHWVGAWIDAARRGPFVFDGDAMMPPNHLAADEPALCKRANSDEGALLAATDRATGRENQEPRCVGVDPWGLHVRTYFDIARVPFREADAPAGTRDMAERAIDNLLKGAR